MDKPESVNTVSAKRLMYNLEMCKDILTMLNSKFKFEVIKNKHNYDGITEPYILIIKMKEDDSFVCCGIGEGMLRRLIKLFSKDIVVNLEPQKEVYTEIEKIIKDPKYETVTIDSYESLGGKDNVCKENA